MGPNVPSPGSPDRRQPVTQLHLWQFQAIRDVLLILSIIGIIWAGYAMRSVTVPLLVALALAYLFEPLVARLNRRGYSRHFVVAAIICTVGITVVAATAFTAPLVIGQTIKLVKDVRSGRFYASALRLETYVPEAYRDEFRSAARFLQSKNLPVPDEDEDLDAPATDDPEVAVATQPAADERASVRAMVREEIALLGLRKEMSPRNDVLLGFARSSAEWAVQLLGSILQFGLVLFLIPFYFFFFSVSYPAVASFVSDLIPRANRARILDLLGQMDRAVAGFVRGRLVICLVVGIILSFGWMIVGVPYAIVLGIVIGAFNAVPYLSGIGLPIAIGLLFFEWIGLPEGGRMAWWGVIVWPSLVYAIAQLLDGYVLTPMIAGKATNLDPVTILVAVLAGGSVGGLYGMLLAIPAFACGKILIKEVLMPRIKSWTRGEVADPLPIGES